MRSRELFARETGTLPISESQVAVTVGVYCHTGFFHPLFYYWILVVQGDFIVIFSLPACNLL
jgi:hypothetical protein